MKKLLLLLVALFLATSAYAECTFFVDPTEFGITKDNVQNGDEIIIPIHANFSARVSAWDLYITFPEGMTVSFMETGQDFMIQYKNKRGRDATVVPPLNNSSEPSEHWTAANSELGYYQVDGSWVSYGTVKWEAGEYEEMLLMYAVFDENYHGGDLVMTLMATSDSDLRGGTVNENGDAGQYFTTTTTLQDPNPTTPQIQNDINGDGELNITDLNAIINAILTGYGSSMSMDVNGDGEINIADCNVMIDIILNWSDDSPHTAGQACEDHLFVRNTYNSQIVDNIVSFKDDNTQLVWIWLDDDMIYSNEAVQHLEPMAYNSSGSTYGEITYNSLQCDIYLPQGFSIVRGENEYGDEIYYNYGDRMPTNSYLTWAQKPNTKIIDGVEYDIYTLIIYNYNLYGSHFSAKNANMYRNNGALKKNDAPLFGIYINYDGQQESMELGDMLIGNQEFFVSEAYSAGWSPNEYRFFYGTGGNNESQRYQLYNRVKLVNGDIPVPAEDTSYYIVGGEPFGNWQTNAGAKMTRNADGTYSYTAAIDGSVWFVLADGLTESPGDWDTFNNQYRYGPISGHDETVEAGTWYTTQKQGNGNGAYQFTGNGSEYVFTFNPYIKKFKIEGDVTPLPQTYTVAGSPGSIFGTEWDPTNRDNDMIQQDDGTYMLQKNGCELYAGETIMFKVVSNRDWSYSWPSDNINIFIGENGTYDFTVTFNPANEEIDYELKKQGSTKLPVEAPLISWNTTDDAVYIEIYWPESDGEQVYTGEYEYPRTNVDRTYNVEAYTLETEAYQESEHATATIVVPAKEEEQGATGELAFQGESNTPAKSWQPSEDHIFARNEYTDAYGNTVMMDNLVSFKDNTTQLVWLWLDDDEIYCNESVQSLTPSAYNSAGDLYNEITYNNCQFDIYLPNDVTLVNASSSESYIGGDRLPSTSTVNWAKINGTKNIDGITYNVYRLVIYNTKAYGSHFSGKDASMYEERGALKKDDAPLLGLWLECSNQSGDEMPDMIIANQIFGLREANNAGWDPNESNFFYGTGGNNESQRFQLYNRVRLVDDYEQPTERTEKPVITADFAEDAVIVSAIGEGVVKLYKEGVLVENPYTVARTNVEQFITFTATAQEEGKLISETETIEICVPAKEMTEQTPAPEITTSMTDNSVVVTATGEGEVKLYIDGVEVSNPYTINRGTEDKTYTATATAQADGMLPSETATASILVPKMDSNGCYLYINDFQIPTSRLGDEIVVPVKAHFDARVSGWVVNLTVPEGLTPVFAEAGGATTVTYLDARGNQQTLKSSFSHNAQYTSMLSYIGSEGYWLPEGASQYENYGVVKWEAGDYGEMALLYLEVDPDFAGGQIVVDSECSSGRDARGGTVPPGERHIYTATFTVGGQELEGELLIGDCDANGMVPVSYTGSEDIILEVLLDGQAAALVDGKAQLMHYGTTTISATATALGHMPLHATATVNWTAINNGDWEILKAFYNQYKNEVLVWDMSDRNKPNSCPGVSSENGRVTAIELPNHQLEGGFPTMLLALDNLTVLDLSYNNLSGDASSDMTQYAAASGIKARGLQELYINNNDFTGNVGALAGLFGNLTTLDVSANHFGQVDPLVNPAVNLSLSNQVLEMNGDITAGLGVLASSLPTICLYDHAGQTFSWDASINLKDMAQSPEWNMELWLDEYSAADNNLYYSWVSGPYRGANGQTLDGYTYLYNSNEDNRQHLLVQFTFNPGDANFNGPVDITDLQAMVNYIFGDYNRLFNFTAANLNNDAIINVQDVVGEANLLLSMELTMPAPALHRAPALDEALTQASLYWEDGTLYLNTTVPVTALDIVNDAEGDITWNVADKGFMVRNATSGQGAHTVIYSLGDAVIEPGVTAIATTTGRTPSVVAAKLSNADAELVEVRLNDRLTGLKSLNEDGKPQCYINGTNLVIASGTGLDNVDIDIYTVDGQKVWGKHVNRLEGGNTSIDLSEIASGHRYYIIVVRNGRQIITTQKLTQIR